ncbi:MAG: hypothetical protein ACYTFG_12560, partial [Planctomycetota bacterium]
MHACEALQREVWGSPDLEIVPVVELISAVKAGGLVAGAFESHSLVGFVYGGWGLEGGEAYHYSRMVAVLGRLRGRGLGLRLKAFQREFVLEKGVTLMRWTFDPLEGGNASLNISKLGAVVDDYIENYYGMKSDSLNQGLPTDRFFLKWFLDHRRVEDRIARRATGPPAKAIFSEPAALSSRPGSRGFPQPVVEEFPGESSAFHAEIPGDIQGMKGADMGLARAWRAALRETSQKAFAEGFR